MRSASSTETSNLITSSSVAQTLLVTISTSSTLVSPNASRTVKESTFPTKMARTSLEQLVMHLSLLTKVLSSHDATILKRSAMSFYIWLRDSCRGRVCQAAPRMKSTTTLRKRRLRLHWKSCVGATQVSSVSSWSTAEVSSSNKSPTTGPASTSLRAACRVTSMTLESSTTPGSKTAYRKIRRL